MTALPRRGFLAAGLAATSCRKAQPRPNILLVISDDQSFPDASAYGAKHVSTPAFDSLAADGALYTHSFCASPSCTPSRSAVLSGKHVWQQGEAGLLYGAMPPSLPLYTHLLEDAGYHTGYTGKGWAPGDWRALGLRRNPCGREYNQLRHSAPVRRGIEPSDYAANFHEFLKQKPEEKPFCFWLGSKEPHRIYDQGSGLRLGKKLEDAQVPPYLPDTARVRSDLLDYYLEIEWYDAQLARTLQILKQSGQLDNTLILATSDNGMPFPRAKVSLYDAGLRMPLAIRWPGHVPKAQTVSHLVSHVDIAPTFLQAAGLPTKEQTLLNPQPRPAVYAAMERHTMCRPDGAGYPMRSLRTPDYLYIKNFAPDRFPTGGDFLSSNKTTHGDIDAAPTKDELLESKNFPEQVKLCLAPRPAEELYHIPSDPHQIHNLAASKPETLTQLRGQLAAHLAATGDPRSRNEDPWQNFPYRQTDGFGASFNTTLSDAARKQARERPTHKPE
jgi:N-sulfoglucosamine sulfohydrolase